MDATFVVHLGANAKQVATTPFLKLRMATNGATLHDIEMFGSGDEGGDAAAARVDSDQDMEGLFGDEDNEQRKDDIS